jgi:hypothetical protein
LRQHQIGEIGFAYFLKQFVGSHVSLGLVSPLQGVAMENIFGFAARNLNPKCPAKHLGSSTGYL